MKPLPIHPDFDALNALLMAKAEQEAPDDEEKQRRLIGWEWFRLVTEPTYADELLQEA